MSGDGDGWRALAEQLERAAHLMEMDAVQLRARALIAAQRAKEADERGGRVSAAAEFGADDVEHIAKAFHDLYERMAPHYGYETRRESAVPWADVPDTNKALMRSVVLSLLQEGFIFPAHNDVVGDE